MVLIEQPRVRVELEGVVITTVWKEGMGGGEGRGGEGGGEGRGEGRGGEGTHESAVHQPACHAHAAPCRILKQPIVRVKHLVRQQLEPLSAGGKGTASYTCNTTT